MTTWNNVQFIQNGEKVDATVSGRPDRALSDRTQYLKERLDALDSGQALFAMDVSIEAEALVGQPVYWNSTNQRFERALAVVEENGGVVTNAESAEVVGVVYSKSSSTVATLVTFGKVALSLSNAFSGTVTAGKYYLSSLEKGKLINNPSSMSVPVLLYDGAGYAYVNPQSKRLFDEHTHHKFSLSMEPAGSTSSTGISGSWDITVADTDIQGWLPADHAIFNGTAPVGAAFGYNLSAHTELEALWPASPSSAALILFSGIDGFGSELPLGVDGYAIVDGNGIWWMRSCVGGAPWDLESSDLQDALACSEPMTVRELVLYFSRVVYCAGVTVVTSLRPDSTSSPLKLKDINGNDATAGDLTISFDGDFLVSDTVDDEGVDAFKSLDGKTFTQGKVVGGIVAANNSVVITSTSNRVDEDDNTVHQGIVTIEANLDGVDRILVPQVVRINDARERYENEVMYLGMPSAVNSSVRYKFKLPSASAFPSNPKLKLRLWLTGDTVTGSFPTLNVTYRRIPKATTATAIPVSDSSLVFTTGMALGVDEYIQKDSEQFTVAESDVVYFTVSRSSSDGYLGEIGILDAVAVLFPG
jgi:hypothetical protein